jgi:FAD-dependent urate hydroxylase
LFTLAKHPGGLHRPSLTRVQGLRVAIVGAGIGGLTTALALQRFGHHPIVVEQTRQLRPVGAGISLWPNGIKVMNLLGLGSDIAAIGGTMDRMAYADRSGRTLLDFSLLDLYERVGERARPVARAELQDLLLDRVRAALGPDAVRLGTRATRVEESSDGVTVTTEDASGAQSGQILADLVVAADGTHSRLRDHIVGHQVERRYVGYVNWNGLVPDTDGIAPPGTWLTWVGDGQRASVMPVGGGRAYFFFDVPMTSEQVTAMMGSAASAATDPAAAPAPDPVATAGTTVAAGRALAGGAVAVATGPDLEGDLLGHRQTLATHFAGWAPPISELIARLNPAGVARIPIHDVDPLPTWTKGRMVLLGDAAHTMSPDLGQGGCQAMEDAWVLTHYLTSTTHSVPNALARYQAERRPHTADIVRRARKRSDITHGVDSSVTTAWYRSLETDGHLGIVDGLAQSVETGPLR